MAIEWKPGEPPGPGIYEGVPEHIYHSWRLASNSALTKLKRSPAHLRASWERPTDPTAAMRFGTAVHCAVLEPERFAALYATAEQCGATTAKGERCANNGTARYGGVWRCGRHPVKDVEPDALELLPEDQIAACKAIRANLHAHPKLRKLLLAPGTTELSVVWDDAETGVRCKARIDRLCEIGGGIVLDLKTTSDARPFAFAKKIFEFGYYRQKAMYQDALRAHGVDTEHLVFAAIENEAPYLVAGYRLSDGAADMGRAELRVLLRRFARCMDADTWPGYDPDIQEISLPAYAWDAIEMEEAA